MIIHNPKISGSLQFPSDENGNLISLTVENGTLETKTLNSSGVDQSIQPAVNYSGSFTGSFVGDGSSLTGVSAINIDALSSLGGATVAQGDNLVVSDAGTEKKVTFSNLEDSVFGNVSGDVVIAAGGVATIQANSVALTTDTTGDYVGTITGGTGITSTAATSGEGTTHSLSVDAAQTQITSVGTIGTGTWQGTTIAVNQGGTGVTTKTGTGNVVLSSSPTLVTPALGTPSALVGTNISGTAANLTVGATTGVEAGADVTDTANVTAAGALMDSELAGIAAVKATTGTFLTADQTKLDTIETNADVTDAANVLTSLPAGVVSGSDQVATTFAQTILDDATAGAVRTTLSLGNVTNESKSTMFATPTFTGVPISTTPSANDSSTKIATTAYVQQELTDLIGTADSTLDTLGELSASLAGDSGSLATLVTTVGTKLAKSTNLSDLADASTARTNLGIAGGSSGQFLKHDGTFGTPSYTTNTNTTYSIQDGELSQNNFTDADHSKLNAIEAGADVTDATNVTAAGALMDSELTSIGSIKALDQSVVSGATPTFTTTNFTDASNKRLMTDAQETKLDSVESSADVTDAANVLTSLPAGIVSGSAQVDYDSISNQPTTISGGQASAISANTSKVGYTAALVKTKLDAETVLSGSAQITALGFSTTDNELTTEEVQDIVGAMFSGNTETRISATYVDGDGTIDLVVDDMTANTTYSVGDGGLTTNDFTDADHTKLNAIEASADVTDAANVLTSLPAGIVSGSDQVATTFAQTILDDATAGAVRTTLGVDAAGTVNYTLPTNLAGDDIDIDTTALTGATVISDLDINITTNTSGLVTDANATVATRTLTATNLSLGNVTNESKGTMFTSPTFTGVPISTTPSANDDSTKIATTAYVQGELTDLLGGAPAAYDTLLEISASISNGDSDVVALTTTVGTKLAKASNLSDLANASTARTNLGVAIGSDVQAYNSTLAAVAGSTYTGDNAITTLGTIGTGTWNGTLIHDDYLSANTVHLDTTQTLSGAKTFSSAVNISDSTASTTKTTGALIVTGGVGISGALNVGGDIVAFASSDERLKDNIELISNPIEKVQSLKGVTWDWNSNADELQQSLPNVGVIAQDVEKVLPQLVTDRDNGFKGVDYAKLTGLLIEAIKDQQKQIEELKNKIS